MRRVDVHAEGASVRLFPAETATLTSPTRLRSTLFGIWIRISVRPATVFIVLSLAFGGLIISGTPPLRGPDEISHFLRIYSYARGEILPTTAVNGRKGILVEPGLYNQLQFFRTAGEVLASGDGLRYQQLVAGYRSSSSLADERDQAPIFAPFAGTEGYNPVAYIPYIAAAAIGRLFKLHFSDMLLFMRWFGLATFTVIAAYAIAVTPALRWAFVLIALLPVSLYNRSVLSADGAAFSTALMITALCLRAAAGPTDERVWERSLWMTLCALSKQPQIVFVLLELMVYRLREWPRQWLRVTSVVLPSIILSPLWVFAVSAEIAAWRLQEEGHHPPEHFDPLWKLLYMWEHPYHFPAGGMACPQRLDASAVAGTHWHRGLAGYFASRLDLPRAHGLSLSRAIAKTSGERRDSCTSGSHYRACCSKLCYIGVSDLFSDLYAS